MFTGFIEEARMTQGIDCSNNNGNAINWQQVKNAGITFAFLKRSEGLGFVDPTFDHNWAEAKRVGLVVGAYSFCHPESDAPDATAEYFCSLLPVLAPGDCVILDVERGNGDVSAWVLECASRVAQQVGFNPIIYSGLSFIQSYLTDQRLSTYPLWVASYNPSIPQQIGPWHDGAAIWQYSEAGSIAGVPDAVDLSETSRDRAGVQALGKPAPAPHPKPKPPFVPYKAATTASCALKPDTSHTSPATKHLPKGSILEVLQPPVTVSKEQWVLVQSGDDQGHIPLICIKKI